MSRSHESSPSYSHEAKNAHLTARLVLTNPIGSKPPNSGGSSRINPHESGGNAPAPLPHPFVPPPKGNPTPPEKQVPHFPKDHQDTDQVTPSVFRNARIKYTWVPPNTNGHGFDIDAVNALGSYRLHTNVRLSTQKYYLLELNRTNAVYGQQYQIQTSENNTNPTFERWLSKPFTYRDYSENSYTYKL